MQEIQPRDTNDFFNSARELDTHHGDNDVQATHTPSNNSGESYREGEICSSLVQFKIITGLLTAELDLSC